MKRLVKTIISTTFLAYLFLLRRKPRFVILYYHAIPATSRSNFARHLDILRSNARVVPADYCGTGEGAKLLVAITFDDAFMSVVENALPELACRNMNATIFAPSGVLGRSPNWEMELTLQDRSEVIASAERLREISSPLVRIGAHSRSHPHLPRLEFAAARQEIAGSRGDLEMSLAMVVDLFAFPYGEYDKQTIGLCKEAGFRHAYTIVPAVIDPTSSEFLRGRTSVLPTDSQYEFWLKMNGGYAWLDWVSAMRRRVFGGGREGGMSSDPQVTS